MSLLSVVTITEEDAVELKGLTLSYMERLHALGMKDSDVHGGSADLVPALQILLFLFRCILIVILDVITLPSVIFFLPLIYITAKVSASLYEGEDEREKICC